MAVALPFVNVPLIGPLPLNGIVEVMPAGLFLVQFPIVPGVDDAETVIGVIEVPLHIDCVKGAMITCGFTVIVNVSGVPWQVALPLV